MSFITTNYSNVKENSFGPLPKGEYEMIIRSAAMSATPRGKEKLQISLVVRNDLGQVQNLAQTNGKHSNRLVFDDHWKRNTERGYELNKDNLMYVLQAVGVPEGRAINSEEDLCDLIMGKPVRVFVDIQFNDYQNKEENTVAPWGYSKTQFPQVNHQWKNSQPANPAPQPEVQKDELPF